MKKFLKCLPRKKYIPIVAALEQVLDLKTTRFKDIIGRLKAYEEHVFDEEDNQDDQGKLMYANMQTEQARDYNNNNRGRGSGGRFYNRGRRRGRYNGTRDATNLRVSGLIRMDMLHIMARIACLSYKQHKKTRALKRRRQTS